MAPLAKTRADWRGRYWLPASLVAVLLLWLGFRYVSSNEGLPHWDGLSPEALASDEQVQTTETTLDEWIAQAASSSERKSIETTPGTIAPTSSEALWWPVDRPGPTEVNFIGPLNTFDNPKAKIEFDRPLTKKNEVPVIDMGRLAVLLPYGQTLRENEAMQYTLQPVGGEASAAIIETVIGGRSDQNHRGLKMTSIGIEFESVAVGNYKVDALVLNKHADGRWLSTSLRMKGEALVRVDQKSSCIVR